MITIHQRWDLMQIADGRLTPAMIDKAASLFTFRLMRDWLEAEAIGHNVRLALGIRYSGANPFAALHQLDRYEFCDQHGCTEAELDSDDTLRFLFRIQYPEE